MNLAAQAPMELDFSRGTLCIAILIGLAALWVIATKNKEK